MTIQTFPVSVVPGTTVEQATRGGTTRNCPRTRHWFTDWHHARRSHGVHHAQDIFAPSGSLVLAPEAGTVVYGDPSPRGGHWLRLIAADRIYYMSHLLERPMVADGARVQAGELIARVGRTGNATTTCPHLHLGARDRGTRAPVNTYAELIAVDPTRAPGSGAK